MSNKENISATVDPEVAAYLNQDDINTSGLINKLLKMEMGEEVVNEQLIKMRMEMEKDRYEDSVRDARGHLERYNRLNERLEEIQQQSERNRKETLEEAAETLDKHQLHEDSNPVEFWAEKADMTIDEFLTEMWERNDD